MIGREESEKHECFNFTVWSAVETCYDNTCSDSDDWSMPVMHCECSELLNVPNYSRNVLVMVLVVLQIENEHYSSENVRCIFVSRNQ